MNEFLIWLRDLPDPVIFLLVTGCLAAIVLLAPFIAIRVLRLPPNERRADGAVEAYKAVASATILVLGFSLLQVQGSLRAADTQIGREAEALNMADRMLLRSGAPELVALRPNLRAYGAAIVDREWALLGRGERSPEVDADFAGIMRRLAAFEPTTPRQQAVMPNLMRSMDKLADLREARIAAARIFLSGLFYWTVIGMVAMLVVLAGLMMPTEARLLQIGGAMVAIGLLFSFVLIIDGPFQGDISARPDGIAGVLAIMAARS